MGADLLALAEESQSTGILSGSINTAFIALIIKKANPRSFPDYRPISLCNVVYKLVAKLIANEIKQILSEHITPEQFGFIATRQIQDAVAVIQECLHSIKTRKLEACLMQIDFIKAYDRVDWEFLGLNLHKVGFACRRIDWIMACLKSANLAILINGLLTYFFKMFRGLRQSF